MANNSDLEKRNNKEVSISIRMHGQDADTLDEVADRVNLNRSELIRKAASNFIKLHAIDNPQYPNPKLFFSHNLLRMLMEQADKEFLQKLAKQSFDNGKHDYTYIKNITDHSTKFRNGATLSEDAVRSVVENVFSEDGQNWFKRVHYDFRGDKIELTGRHDLGKKFSLFIKYLLKHYLDEINYVLVKSEMGETEIMENGQNRVFFYIKFVYKKQKQVET